MFGYTLYLLIQKSADTRTRTTHSRARQVGRGSRARLSRAVTGVAVGSGESERTESGETRTRRDTGEDSVTRDLFRTLLNLYIFTVL